MASLVIVLWSDYGLLVMTQPVPSLGCDERCAVRPSPAREPRAKPCAGA